MAGSFAPEFDQQRPSTALALTFDQPVRALEATRARNLVNTSVYEGGAQTRRTATWNAPTTSANSGVLANIITLRDRSYAAVRNNGFAFGIIDALVNDLIGYGIKPLPRTKDAKLRQQIMDLWNQWIKVSATNGSLGWYGQQRQIARSWLEGGECFVYLRDRFSTDNLPVPLQIQVIEPHFCPHNHTGFNGGNRYRAGIEYDGVGRRVAYYLYQERPADPNDMDRSRLLRIAEEFVVHVFDEERPGQLRGLPRLTRALIVLNELDKYDDATLLRQQIGNLFAGFVKRTPSNLTPAVDPLTGETPDETDEGKPMVSLEAGIMQELGADEEVTFADPPDPPNSYGDFVRSQLIRAGVASGVPYEVLTGDMSKVNDRTVRAILTSYRRKIQTLQHEIIAHQLCRRVWRAWFQAAVDSRALPISPAAYKAHPEQFDAVAWTPPKWDYINPVQDIEAQKEAIRNGLTSRSATVSENGEDPETIDAEQAADNARADTLGIKYDSDGRNASNGALPPAPPGDPNGDPTAAGPDGDEPHPAPSQNTIRLELATAPMRVVRDEVGRTIGLEAVP